MFEFLLSIFLILLCKPAQSQDRFIVFVSEYISGNLSGAVGRCPVTIITERHVLTTAGRATPTNSSLQLAIDIRFSFPGGSSSSKIPVERAFIHPNYTGVVHSNNVAVVMLEGTFNSTILPPRTLGSIQTNASCRLFGLGGASDNPETEDVEAYEPQFCNSNQPQAYCTQLSAPTRACQAYPGSPLVCNAQSVDGISLQTGCSEVSPGRFLLAYHSVGEFKEWIEIVSSAKIMNISTTFFLSALIISLKNSLWI